MGVSHLVVVHTDLISTSARQRQLGRARSPPRVVGNVVAAEKAADRATVVVEVGAHEVMAGAADIAVLDFDVASTPDGVRLSRAALRIRQSGEHRLRGQSASLRLGRSAFSGDEVGHEAVYVRVRGMHVRGSCTDGA